MIRSQVQCFIVILGLSLFAGITFADEKRFAVALNDPFYSGEFPKERLGLWTSVSRSLAHMKYKEVLKKLEEIDEFSDECGLSLLEFRNTVAIKYFCIVSVTDIDDVSQQKAILIEYLDRVANYIRKSIQWQKDSFVMEYHLSHYYAALSEFKKADESVSRLQKIIREVPDEWEHFSSLWDRLAFVYHVACIYAALGEDDKAIEVYDSILKTDSILLKDTTALDAFHTELRLSGAGQEDYQSLINEIRKKRECFMEKGEWSYYCKPSFMIIFPDKTNNDNAHKWYGLGLYIQWFSKKGKWTTLPAFDHSVPYLTRVFFPLPTPSTSPALGRPWPPRPLRLSRSP